MRKQRLQVIFASLVLVFLAAFPAIARAGMVTLTFDDGLKSVVDKAFPILQKYGLPAVAGAIVSEMESDGPDFMRPGDLMRLQQAGWEIASHSVSHRRCQDLPGGFGQEVLSDVHPDERDPSQFVAVYEYPVLAGLLCQDKPLRRAYRRGEVHVSPGTYYYDEAVRSLIVRPFTPQKDAPEIRAVSFEREMRESRERLFALGFHVTSFIAPFNAWTQAMRDMSVRYYAQAVSGGDGANPRQDSDRHWIRRYNVLSDVSLAWLEEIVRTEAVEKDGWVVFCLHGVGAGAGWEPLSTEKLEALARYLKDCGAHTVTLDQGARRFFENAPSPQAKG